MSENNLPSVPYDRYLYDDYRLLSREASAAYADVIGNTYAGMSNEEKLETIMSEEEQLLMEGVLKFVDYCLAKRGWTGTNTARSISRARATTRGILSYCREAEVDVDDLTQEARLATIRAVRNYDSSKGSKWPASVFAIIPRSILWRITAVGADAHRSGLKGGTGIKGVGDELHRTTQNAFINSLEGGWSDKITALNDHPGFLERVDLDFDDKVTPESLVHEDSPDQHPVDVEAAKLSPEERFDKFLGLIAEHVSFIRPRTLEFFKLHHLMGLSPQEIADMQEPPISRQAVNESILKGYALVRASRLASEALKDCLNI
ncbi:MAG TPA: hypothetical protein VIH90_03435 [Candidatus Saccharimonadales bacterium]